MQLYQKTDYIFYRLCMMVQHVSMLPRGNVMRPHMSWLTRFTLALVVAFATSAPILAAEPWPQRPVRVIVPIGAGSGSDVAARLFAEKLADRWKQPVLIENRPGADGL